MANEVTSSTIKPTRDQLASVLPEYKWDIIKAGIAIGYSETYAKSRLPSLCRKDVSFQAKVEEVKEALRNQYTPGQWFQDIIDHRNMCEDAEEYATMRAYDDMLGRHIGAYEADKDKQSDDAQTFTAEERAMLQAIAKEFRRRKAIASVTRDSHDMRYSGDSDSTSHLIGEDVTCE